MDAELLRTENEIEADKQISLLQTVNEMHKKNKLNKANVWDFDFINSFQSLIRNHHRYTSNFQNVCPSLDTVSRIYELRIDSVLTDVFRLARKTPVSSPLNVNESIQTQSDIFGVTPTQENQNQPHHKRRNKNKICNNIAPTQSLIGPLRILLSRPNQFMAILEQSVSEISSTNKVLLYLSLINGSNDNLFGEIPYFDQRPAECIVEFDYNDDYDVSDDMYIELPTEFNTENKVFRQSASGYVLKGVLGDDDDISYRESTSDRFQISYFEYGDMEDDEFHHEAGLETNSSYQSNDNVNEINDATNAEQQYDDTQSHPHSKDLSKKQYSCFENIEKLSKGPSCWRLKGILKRRLEKEAHMPPKRKKRKLAALPTFGSSGSEIESEDDNNWGYKPVNTALWDPEDNSLPQYRKNAFNKIKPYFFDHHEFALKLLTWGENFGQPRRKRSSLRRSERILDSSDTSDYSPCEKDQLTDKHRKFSSANASNSLDAASVLDPEAGRSTSSEVQDISLEYYEPIPEVGKIDVQYNLYKLPKQINMKKVNAAVLESIYEQFRNSLDVNPINAKENEMFEKGFATFASTHGSVRKRFRNIATPSITLLSILFNAHVHRFKLDQVSADKDFKLRRIKK